jgi:hypothetical protein
LNFLGHNIPAVHVTVCHFTGHIFITSKFNTSFELRHVYHEY